MQSITFGIVIITIIFLTVLIKKQKVSMRTLVWPYMMLFAMFVVVYPPVLRFLTKILGFTNTENLVFFIMCGYFFVITVVHEVRIAKLNDKNTELTRTIAILSKEQNDHNRHN
ncbi:DUF2304 domain-containing protein [Mollicutes bacterium LVI A0039]|nr:DUF2304 domain-containing protein [Mollicutes bacterium LVI A0039]